MEAAIQSDFIRGYVRLYKTPPARLKIDNSQEEQVSDAGGYEGPYIRAVRPSHACKG